MFNNRYRYLFFLALFLCVASASAQQPPANPGAHRITLDVVVTPKSGQPVSGLQQQDFTVLDNKAPQTIASFQAFDNRNAPVQVIVVIDAVNTDYQHLAYERDEIDKFLRAEGGALVYPTTFAILTDTGMQYPSDFSSDGNKLGDALNQSVVGLRILHSNEGFYAAEERVGISLQALSDLAMREASRPGRKVILWVSPGWPLLSGPNVELDAKQEQQLFSNVVNFSTQFLKGRITLYSIDPLGTADGGAYDTFYWKEFVKGISKLSQAQPGDLALEVLATQSGGLALNASNNVTGLLQRCIADNAAYYEISFDAPASNKPNEYHQLEIRVDKPGMTARTRLGYYSQP